MIIYLSSELNIIDIVSFYLMYDNILSLKVKSMHSLMYHYFLNFILIFILYIYFVLSLVKICLIIKVARLRISSFKLFNAISCKIL